MLFYILPFCGGLLLLWLLWDRFGRKRGVSFSRILWGLVLAGLVALGILLLLTGKFAGILAVAAGLWPWVSRAMRVHSLWRWLRSLGNRRTDGTPHSHDTDSRQKRPPAPPSSGMTEADAREILGVPEGASQEDIRAAHRRLMMNNHPDHGGSTWIATRINQARDRLLKS